MATFGDWKDVLRNTDIDTARLIINTQLEDLGARRRRGSLDNNLALQLYEAELCQCRGDLPDRQLGEDLEDDDNDFEAGLEGAAFGWRYDEYKNTVEPVEEPPKLVTCTVCGDDFHHTLTGKMPCGHDYCRDCLEELYNASMTDESLFPPRCCQKEFPWELVRNLLSQRCKSKFGSKRRELEVKDRTYCYVPSCSAFIHPSTYVGNAAPCPRVDLQHGYTCVDCKQTYHFGPCPRNLELETVMGAAGANGWQRCFGCRRVVELKHGCNHMTCVCRSQFCYVCGVEWKNCACPQWDENRLIERAADAVDNGRAHVDRNQGRAEMVAQAAEYLRDNHECTHERFRSTFNRGTEYDCEICGTTYNDWIYQCRQCWMTICNRCRHNRV